MKKNNKLLAWFFSAYLLLLSGVTFAESPATLLQSAANQMISQLEANKSHLNNKAVLHRIVNSTLVPNIDANRMAGMVVGRENWYSATPAQRHEFVNQFKQLIINTYSNALASYDGDKVTVSPGRAADSSRFVSVQSVIVRKNGQHIPITYYMLNGNNGWKIYDFSVENVSIVQNYRSQFSGVLANGGMVKLIDKLHEFNREN